MRKEKYKRKREMRTEKKKPGFQTEIRNEKKKKKEKRERNESIWNTKHNWCYIKLLL